MLLIKVKVVTLTFVEHLCFLRIRTNKSSKIKCIVCTQPLEQQIKAFSDLTSLPAGQHHLFVLFQRLVKTTILLRSWDIRHLD